MLNPEATPFVPSSCHAVPALPDEPDTTTRLEVMKQIDEQTRRSADGVAVSVDSTIVIRLVFAGREIASWKGLQRRDCHGGELLEARGTVDFELATDRSALTLLRANGERRTMPLNIEERLASLCGVERGS